MILSYRDKRTELFSRGEFVRAFQGVEQQAVRRLAILNATPSLNTLRALPSNRLEALSGDGAGQFPFASISSGVSALNGRTDNQGPANVEIVDYHH